MSLLILTLLTFGFGVGVYISEVSKHATEVACLSFGVAICMSVMLFLYQLFSIKKKMVPMIFFVISCGVVMGIVRGQFVTHDSILVCEKKCQVEGVVSSHVVIRDTYQQFSVDASSSSSTYMQVMVRAPLYPKVHVGDMVILTGVVSPIVARPPHGDVSSFPYDKYMLTKNIGSEMYYPTLHSTSSSTSPTMKLKRLKETSTDHLEQYIDQPAVLLVSGMLLGDTQFSKEEKSLFRVSGLSHVVVLSGFNVALVINVVLFVLKMVPLYVRVMASSVLTCMFVVMVGGEASVVRATLMAHIALMALAVGRGYNALHALLSSLLVFGMWSPEALLYDVSLHLSFLATFGVVYVREKIASSMEGSDTWYKELFVSSFSAYIMTLPYSMYMFGSVSVYALLANMIVLPLVPVLMALGGGVLVMSFTVPYVAVFLGYLATIVGGGVFLVARGVTLLPFSSFQFHISFFSMLVMYTVLFSSLFFLVKKKENETRETKQDETWSPVISF